jgi:hypothetical protein
MEYCGEVVSDKVAQSRVQVYEEVGLKEKYIISLHGSEFIDATRKGSLARYINHSCDPNCVTRKWTVLGEVRIGIFAIKDISAETEVTYDYNFQWYGGSKIQCRCGAESCVGFLGAKSRGFQVALLPIHGDIFLVFPIYSCWFGYSSGIVQGSQNSNSCELSRLSQPILFK